MNDTSSNKDNKVKDDGCIYMVLEYGEIDLAHMLSQKWREIERSNSTMDENWLRFYWQVSGLILGLLKLDRSCSFMQKKLRYLLNLFVLSY